ncbi:MAG TPA: hypothetical protein VFM31_09485, partial [Nitrososphaeraceae archaeon]|nr:hypothetical protein [Nitrososphaeraceae archaeon]
MILFNTNNFNNLRVYGHLFTPNETATFVGILDQVQAELKLVVTNLENNNVPLAQNHAIKASSLLTPRILNEITEDNPRLTDNLRRAISQLQNMSSSSEGQLKSISQLVNDLNRRMDEDAIVRIAQLQPTSSNFLEGALKSLEGIFGGSNTNQDLDENTKLQALALANVIDEVLINYGKAYDVGFDMTNMSNMVMMGNNSSSPNSMVMNNPGIDNTSGIRNMNMDMPSTNTSSNTMTMMQQGGKMNMGYSLSNISDYQSAQGIAEKALEIFNTKLKNTISIDNKKVTAFLTNLENGLTHLN